MTQVIKIELEKLYRSKNNLSSFVALSVLMIITFLLTYSMKETRYNYAVYIYYIFAVNAPVLLPFVTSMLFSSVVIDEFQNSTIKVLRTSKFRMSEIFFAKLVSTWIVFIISLIFVTLIYIVATTLLFGVKDWELFVFFTKNELIKRFLSVFLAQIIYLFVYATFISLISWIIKKKYIVLLISIALPIIFKLLPPLPSNLGEYLFFNSSPIVFSFTRENFILTPLLKNMSLNITFSAIFILIAILIVDRQEYI